MAMEGRRRLVQVLPSSMQEWWDQWELRGLVFISLGAQIVLTLLGNHRKYGTNKLIESIVWSTYYLVDNVPTFAIGVISSKLGDFYNKHEQQIEDPQLIAFWAPFFLIHIGGPDTITAYSLEDNELWLRHLIGLVVQTLATIYIILLAWRTTSWLSWLSIPMLVIGFVKYGEKTWSLYSASINYCRHSWFSSTVPETEIEDECTTKRFPLIKGFMAFFVTIFSDVVLEPRDIEALRVHFNSFSYRTFFRYVDFAHGLSYDILYTKSSTILTIWGCILRLITLITVVIMFICYLSIFSNQLYNYSSFDAIVTCLLLMATVILEFFSIIILVLSFEWLNYAITNDECSILFLPTIANWLKRRNLKKSAKWTSVGQCNFLTFYLKHNKLVGDSFSPRKVENFFNISSSPVFEGFKKMLWKNAKDKSMGSTPIQHRAIPLYKELVEAQRLSNLRLIIENLEFHQSILLWHIVTIVCYYCDDQENQVDSKESKMASDYMFYILMKRRHMLPVGAGLLALRDTYLEAAKFCQKHQILTLSLDESKAYKTLLEHFTYDAEYVATTRPMGRSVFNYAFVTAHDLLARQSMTEIWKFLINLWIEIMNHGAANCKVDRHAQELANGGEFITHIWYLQIVASFLQDPCRQSENV